MATTSTPIRSARNRGGELKASPPRFSLGPAIKTSGLSKRFGSTEALRELDIEVSRGSVFGFLGPNGAGKTTTIRLLLDLIRPSAGSASVLGLDANRESVAVRRRCGYLPGELKLPERPSGGTYLEFLARLREDVPPGRVASLAERLHLDLGRRIGDLSKGNRQKIGVIAAFMGDPDLVILDEPTAGLDPLRQEEVHRLIRETAGKGRTVFLSSHALDEVEHVADEVAMIKEGSLLVQERTDSLREHAVREVAVRFASPAPDLRGIPGVSRVEVEGDKLRLRIAGSMDPLVKALAASRVESLDSAPPELDQVFLSMYQEREG